MTVQKKHLTLIIIIALLVIVAAYSWIGELNHKLFIKNKDFEEQRQKITQLINKLKVAKHPQEQYLSQLKFIHKNKKLLWNTQKNGRAEIELGTIIKNLARRSDFEFDIVSSVKKKSSNMEGLHKYSVLIRGKATTQQFAVFTTLISQQRPKLSWSNLNITNSHVIKKMGQKRITIQGTLMAVEIADKNIIKTLKRFDKKGGRK